MAQDYYQILGVGKDANERDIKKAYKRMAMKYHPDRTKGDKELEAKFKEIKQAYEVLSDPQKRQMYDQYGHEAFQQARQGGGAGAGGFGGGGRRWLLWDWPRLRSEMKWFLVDLIDVLEMSDKASVVLCDAIVR